MDTANTNPLVRHMIAHRLSFVEGYHGTRAQACEAVAWFINQWEGQRSKWVVVVVSGSMRMSMRNLGEIASHLRDFRRSSSFASEVRGVHGRAIVIPQDRPERTMMFGENILYLIDDGVSLEMVDTILHRTTDGVSRVIAINPPVEMMKHFVPLIPEVMNA